MIILERYDNIDAVRDIVKQCKNFISGKSEKDPSGRLDGIQFWVDSDALYFSKDDDGSYAAVMFDEIRDFSFDDVVESIMYQLNNTVEGEDAE